VEDFALWQCLLQLDHARNRYFGAFTPKYLELTALGHLLEALIGYLSETQAEPGKLLPQ
jgi:hypothetical protein